MDDLEEEGYKDSSDDHGKEKGLGLVIKEQAHNPILEPMFLLTLPPIPPRKKIRRKLTISNIRPVMVLISMVRSRRRIVTSISSSLSVHPINAFSYCADAYHT